MFRFGKPMTLPTAAEALPGRARPIVEPRPHAVLGTSLVPPFPADSAQLVVGLGCFWGAERLFWQLPGVFTTSVGYAGGHTPNPTYEEVCSGHTGHTEAVEIIYDPARLGLEQLLSVFWEAHDPTQGMRQGNDIGTQYRSAIYTATEVDLEFAIASRDAYQRQLLVAGYGVITTEIAMAGAYFLAEDYHQQYLYKNPNGYCGLAGCGVGFSMHPQSGAAPDKVQVRGGG